MNQYRKPDFFIVGAPKCGTTSMYYYLRQHPQIFMPDCKEPHYFGKDLQWNSDEFINKENEYLNLFKYANPDQKLGEASTFYLYSKSAAWEIKNYNPNAKIIIMLRNPIDFLHSLHSQLLFSGNEDEHNFEIALDLEKERMLGNKLPKNIDMIDRIFYLEHALRIPGQIRSYIDIFGRKNIAVIILDDLHAKPNKCYLKILKFLNVDTNITLEYSIHNSNKSVRSFWIRNFIKRHHNNLSKLRSKYFKQSIGVINYLMKINTKESPRQNISDDFRNKLMNKLNPSIEELEDIINIKLNHWKILI